jgi:hypothetical protein
MDIVTNIGTHRNSETASVVNAVHVVHAVHWVHAVHVVHVVHVVYLQISTAYGVSYTWHQLQAPQVSWISKNIFNLSFFLNTGWCLRNFLFIFGHISTFNPNFGCMYVPLLVLYRKKFKIEAPFP